MMQLKKNILKIINACIGEIDKKNGIEQSRFLISVINQ